MTDIRTTITRKYGLSTEDADKVIELVATETVERLQAEQADALTDTHERDQEDAAIFDVSKSVARHFRTLRAEGMGESSAVELCQSFQFSLMGGSDATLTVVGMEGDE